MQKYVKRKDGSLDIQEIFPTEGENENMCDQQYKDECDINYKMRQYTYNALPDPQRGVYADVSEIKSYQESLNVVMKAEQMFGDLPSNIRTKFQNDPAEMVKFLSDTKNHDEAVELGLVVRKVKTDSEKLLEKLDELKPKQ